MLTIRGGTEKDAAVCARLSKIKELKGPTGWVPTKSYFKLLLEENEIFLLAEENKEVRAYALGERLLGKGVMLWFIVVDPKYLRKSISALIFKVLGKECKEGK